MPIYEYICDDCKARYERVVMSKKTVVKCPECGSRRGEQVPSVFAGRVGSLKTIYQAETDSRADFRAKYHEGWTKEQAKKRAKTPKSGGPRRAPSKMPRVV